MFGQFRQNPGQPSASSMIALSFKSNHPDARHVLQIKKPMRKVETHLQAMTELIDV